VIHVVVELTVTRECPYSGTIVVFSPFFAL
jgi:hypothetical protein